MTHEAAKGTPDPPSGWPREVKIVGTLSELEVALVVPAGTPIHYPRGQRIQMPFYVLRRLYRRSR